MRYNYAWEGVMWPEYKYSEVRSSWLWFLSLRKKYLTCPTHLWLVLKVPLHWSFGYSVSYWLFTLVQNTRIRATQRSTELRHQQGIFRVVSKTSGSGGCPIKPALTLTTGGGIFLLWAITRPDLPSVGRTWVDLVHHFASRRIHVTIMPSWQIF